MLIDVAREKKINRELCFAQFLFAALWVIRFCQSKAVFIALAEGGGLNWLECHSMRQKVAG